MTRRGPTTEEREACISLYRKLNRAMDGHEINEIMNTLCFIIADIGVDELDMDKKEFVATLVEQISDAYDTLHLARVKPQGEA